MLSIGKTSFSSRSTSSSSLVLHIYQVHRDMGNAAHLLKRDVWVIVIITVEL
jgi:hypothetical protein